MDGIRYGRKRSGIKKALKEKLTDWMESIDDTETQRAVKNNAIVTGGAIASMLLGEKVNDYDVYLRTKEAATIVAQYYVTKLRERDPSCTTEVYVEEDRVRLFTPSKGIAGEDQADEHRPEDAAATFTASTSEADDAAPRYRPSFISENAITLTDSVQVVVRFYGDPNEIHKNYDFVHATCSYDFKTGELRLPGSALESLLSRHLIYQGSLYPVASIFRMKKFLERGWRITAGQQLKIMFQISELNMTYHEGPTDEEKSEVLNTLREQLTGVDMAYLYEVLAVLHKEHPERIDSTYMAEILDRIFD